MRAIDRLKAAVSMTPTCRSMDLPNGDQFSYYAPPMTLSQRAKAQKLAGSDDSTGFALQLLVMLATDENGQKLFTQADLAELTNTLPASMVETLMLQLLTWNPESDVDKLYESIPAEMFDMKSSQVAAKQGDAPVSADVSSAKA